MDVTVPFLLINLLNFLCWIKCGHSFITPPPLKYQSHLGVFYRVKNNFLEFAVNKIWGLHLVFDFSQIKLRSVAINIHRTRAVCLTLYLSPAVNVLHIKKELTTYPDVIEVQSAGAWSSDSKFHLLFSNLKPRCVSFHRKTSDTFVALKQSNMKILSKTAAVFFKDIKSLFNCS